MRFNPTIKQAEDIYDILEQVCGANKDLRFDFVSYITRPLPWGHEYRFQGNLSFGGKLYSNSQGVYVDCYSEHKTVQVASEIDEANKRINELLNQ
jgi:hypothetical protein